jgi:hypothetical protein
MTNGKNWKLKMSFKGKQGNKLRVVLRLFNGSTISSILIFGKEPSKLLLK